MTPQPLVEQRIVCRQTTLAAITDCVASPDAGASDRPVLVFLHDANRMAAVMLDDLAPYRAWADVLLPDLPGSGGSEPPLDVGIGPMADEIVCLIRRVVPNRRLILIGESTGGLVSLACCDGRLPVAALVLLDPPLCMAKQWVVQYNLMRNCERTSHWFPHALASAVFGLDCATETVQERLYYAAFADLKTPCLIVRGDSPLFPVRTPERVPCCFDDVDETIVRLLLPSCRIERLSECGHLIYIDGGMRCHDLIHGFVATLADG